MPDKALPPKAPAREPDSLVAQTLDDEPSVFDRSIPSEAIVVPSRLGPYDLLAPLGKGGMGELWRAWDSRLERSVAIKWVKAIKQGDHIARARFWREARSLAAVSHPGIVTIYDIGESPSGRLFIAMELLEGEPLTHFLHQPWPLASIPFT